MLSRKGVCKFSSQIFSCGKTSQVKNDSGRNDLEEFVAPIAEALIAVAGLLAVGACVVLKPVDEKIFVLLQHQKLKEKKKFKD